MIQSLLNALLGCSHPRTTFPITPARKSEAYVVCLDCGKEFAYDWKTMRVGQPVKTAPAYASPIQEGRAAL
jgi:hypothetical protein